MNDFEIANALKRLPRLSASPRFTSDVIRAARWEPEPRRVWRYAAAFALTCCLVVFGIHAMQLRTQRGLRAERQRIHTELQQVKRIAGEQRPVIVLENDDARFIVDVAGRGSETSPNPVY